ncbi:MAG TPA: hypothetical protein VHG51_17685 [Longimicrobiaceae bacterium]|nr:hypothetical protein [Longimicrobiaceae bacterium]
MANAQIEAPVRTTDAWTVVLQEHEVLLDRLIEDDGPSLDELEAFLSQVVEVSPEVTCLEDRDVLRHIMRYWGSYISLRGGLLPDLDLDTPDRHPQVVTARRRPADASDVEVSATGGTARTSATAERNEPLRLGGSTRDRSMGSPRRTAEYEYDMGLRRISRDDRPRYAARAQRYDSDYREPDRE